MQLYSCGMSLSGKLGGIMFTSNISVFLILVGVGIVSGSDGNETSTSLNPTQQKALEKFKQQMLPHIEKEYMKDDFYLTRWLEAKNWVVSDAEAMLTQNLQWRKQNRMDTINEENWTDMTREYPYQTDTIDKDGSPVGTLTAKDWNIRRAVSRAHTPRLQRYMYKMLEDLTNKLYQARAEGKNVTQWSAIINADGFGLLQHACPSCITALYQLYSRIPVWVNFVKSASDRYPGYVESISLINVPRPLVRILRPIFSSGSLKIFGSDKKAWMKYLDEKIDKTERRVEYGGSRA